MRTRLEIVSKLVEDKHITFEEGMMLMEPVKHPLNFPGFRGITEPIRPTQQPYRNTEILCKTYSLSNNLI